MRIEIRFSNWFDTLNARTWGLPLLDLTLCGCPEMVELIITFCGIGITIMFIGRQNG